MIACLGTPGLSLTSIGLIDAFFPQSASNIRIVVPPRHSVMPFEPSSPQEQRTMERNLSCTIHKTPCVDSESSTYHPQTSWRLGKFNISYLSTRDPVILSHNW